MDLADMPGSIKETRGISEDEKETREVSLLLMLPANQGTTGSAPLTKCLPNEISTVKSDLRETIEKMSGSVSQLVTHETPQVKKQKCKAFPKLRLAKTTAAVSMDKLPELTSNKRPRKSAKSPKISEAVKESYEAIAKLKLSERPKSKKDHEVILQANICPDKESCETFTSNIKQSRRSRGKKSQAASLPYLLEAKNKSNEVFMCQENVIVISGDEEKLTCGAGSKSLDISRNILPTLECSENNESYVTASTQNLSLDENHLSNDCSHLKLSKTSENEFQSSQGISEFKLVKETKTFSPVFQLKLLENEIKASEGVLSESLNISNNEEETSQVVPEFKPPLKFGTKTKTFEPQNEIEASEGVSQTKISNNKTKTSRFQTDEPKALTLGVNEQCNVRYNVDISTNYIIDYKELSQEVSAVPKYTFKELGSGYEEDSFIDNSSMENDAFEGEISYCLRLDGKTHNNNCIHKISLQE